MINHQNIFYKVGFWCFLVIGLANVGSLYINSSHLNIFEKVSYLAFTLFYFVSAWFFNWMEKMANPLKSSVESSDKDFNEAFTELQGDKKDVLEQKIKIGGKKNGKKFKNGA